MTGRLLEPTVNRDGTMNLIVAVDTDFSALYEELKGGEVEVEVRKRSKRRSLDANAYAWVLIDKIAEKMDLKKTDVYLNTIREVGGIHARVDVPALFAQDFINTWMTGHIGRDAQIVGDGEPGMKTIKVRLGSSDFSSVQMNHFISILVQDAESLGIPTITDKEAERMIGKWAVAKGERNEKPETDGH